MKMLRIGHTVSLFLGVMFHIEVQGGVNAHIKSPLFDQSSNSQIIQQLQEVVCGRKM